MVDIKVGELDFVKLSDYLTPGKFRTVDSKIAKLEGGISEVRVIFNLHDKFTKNLSFYHSNINVIYGFGIMQKELIKVNKGKYSYRYLRNPGIVTRISINDCGDRFVMVIERKEMNEILYAITVEEVENLLNNCIHPSRAEN